MKINSMVLVFLLWLTMANTLQAQVNYKAVSGSITIAGTSSMHNWELKSKDIAVTATFDVDIDGKLSEVIALNFEMVSTTLKSGKTGLDDNAYVSLDSKNFRAIKFAALQGTIKPNADNLIIRCNGMLQVAGKGINTEVTTTCKLSPDGTLTCTGTKDLKMTDFNIAPPTYMMGTITTGNDIKLSFTTVLKKQ